LSVFVAVVLYYLIVFVFYAFSDFMMHLRAVDLAQSELERRRARTGGLTGIPGEVSAADTTPWRLVGLVPLTSSGRIFVDFILPVIVGMLAIVCLVVGIYGVYNKHASSSSGYSRSQPKEAAVLASC